MPDRNPTQNKSHLSQNHFRILQNKQRIPVHTEQKLTKQIYVSILKPEVSVGNIKQNTPTSTVVCDGFVNNAYYRSI
jgi:hypothetical protein